MTIAGGVKEDIAGRDNVDLLAAVSAVSIRR
jgi:hypothetical protein